MKNCFTSSDSFKAPENEINRQSEIIKQLDELGIDFFILGNTTEEFNKDELYAINCIYNNEIIPDVVKQRIIQKNSNKIKNRHTNKDNTIRLSDKQINKIIGDQ